MPDHDQIVDQIRAIVQATDQTRTPAMDALAAAYAEACAEVGRRLVRCQRLLQQGLRSEAIQLAETAPRLLDAMATLDFPERYLWVELVQLYGLPEPQKLSMETAAFLNEAYALEDPLQDLLRSHRRLALERAALPQRIDVMRKLAALDPNNPVWQDDLRTFEKVRFHQIQHEAAEAARRNDADAVGKLLAELEGQAWLEAPPPALLQGLRKSDAQFRGQKNRAMLADLESQLTDAYAARDPIRGRLARDRYLALAASIRLSSRDPIHGRMAAALDWLEQQDIREEADRQHEDAIRDLIAAIDDPRHIPPSELERLGNAVLGHERGISEALQKRYLDRLWTAHAAADRRRRQIIGGSAVAAGLVLGLAFLAFRHQARERDAAQAAQALADMLELGEFGRAGEFVKKLGQADATLLDHPAMAEARTRLESAQQKEIDRAVKFDQAIRQAEQAPVTEPKPPALEEARSLARLATEKEAVEKLSQRRQATLAEERSRRDQAIAPRLADVAARIDSNRAALDAAPVGSQAANDALGALAGVQKELTDIGAEAALAGDEVQARARVLSESIGQIHARQDAQRRLAALERQITAAVEYSTADVASLDPFAELLRQHAKAFPDSPRSKALEHVAAEAPIWNSMLAWHKLTAGIAGDFAQLSPEQAQEQLARCTKFLAENSRFPFVDRISRYQRFLESVVRRGDKADGSIRRLQRLLSDVLIDSIWMIHVLDEDGGNKRFYLTRRPRGSADILQIRYLCGFDGKEREGAILRTTIKRSDWSPQTRIAGTYRPLLGQADIFSAWDETMIKLLDAIRTGPDMDPLLQLTLIRRVVDIAGEGSDPLRIALQPVKLALDQADIDPNAPWMDPENADAERLRPRAASVVLALPDLQGVLKQARSELGQVQDLVTRFPRSVGWLVRDGGAWKLRTGSNLPADCELWAAVPDGDRSAWKLAGNIRNKAVSLARGTDALFAEGRPLFAMVK